MLNNNLHDIYLGLGTNLGDKENNLKLALDAIEQQIGKVASLSAFYETKPVGFESDNLFLNAACHVKTRLEPFQVLEKTQFIERMLGRDSKSQNSVYVDRLIDIDVLLFDEVVLSYSNLEIPHPSFHKREFVLKPLCEIANNVLHPVLKKTIAELTYNLCFASNVE